jgi:dsDNA-specific endonuclease/ATPase MutS2
MKLAKGDRVMVLDDAMEGVLVSVEGDVATIETTAGFLLYYKLKELLKIEDMSSLHSSFNSDQVKHTKEEKKPNYKKVEPKSKKERPIPEFDLHIEKLVKNHKSLSNFDILTIQIDTAKRHVDFAIKNRIPRIIFIHGVGEGVLKAELDFFLGRYEQIKFQDANYQKYGQGATEVYLIQSSL